MQVIEGRARSQADRERVWRVVADAPAWSRWGAWQKAELEREGDPPPGGGTDIVWRSQFEPKVPLTGGLFRRSLGKFIQDTAERLAREAERS